MPIYEYRCDDCAKDSSILVRSPKTAKPPKCEHCGSAKVSRKISAVARKRSVGDVVSEYGSDLGGGGIRDPRQIGHWVEKRFEQFGVGVPKSTRDMIDSARDGVLPPGLDI
jgi:putative FmdB family regulatory protein